MMPSRRYLCIGINNVDVHQSFVITLFCADYEKPEGWGASARGVVTSYTGDRVSQIPDPQLLESTTLVKWWSMHLQLCQTPDSSMGMTHCRVNEFCVFFFSCSFLPHLQFLTQSVIPPFLKSDGLVHFKDVRPRGPQQVPLAVYFIILSSYLTQQLRLMVFF